MRRLASQKFCTRLQNSRKLATQSPISLSEKLRLKRVAGDTNSNDTEEAIDNIHYIDENLPSGFTDGTEQFPSADNGAYRPQSNEKKFRLDPFKSTSINPVKVDQPRIPQLVSSLSRVLFQPSHPVWLRCPRTGVYNFPSHLEDIHPPEEFAFDRLPPYMTSSKDKDLIELTKKQKCRYLGSTSSMTSVLSHIHLLLTNWKPVNFESLSEDFQGMSDNFSYSTKLPGAIVLRKIDQESSETTEEPIYAIDKDKSYDLEEDNVLLWVGTQLEKQLTMPTDEFSGLLRANPITDAVKEKMTEREAYHYSKANKILMRSQLDCFDSRLPRKTFDIKTRAVVAVRMDVLNYRAGGGYSIKKSRGLFESFEREYYDMVRSAFLKYSLQARIGAMDGIFVAYHNTQRIFGFQYVPLEEMDQRIYGSSVMANQSFKHSIGILERALDDATALIPDESLSITFDTREGDQYMSVYVESAEDTSENKVTYVIDYEVKSYINNKAVPKDKFVDFATIKNENASWTVEVTSRTSKVEESDKVKANLALCRQAFHDMNKVVLPPGMSAQDLMKMREERRGWRGQNGNDEEVEIKLRNIEEEREHYIKERFQGFGDSTSPQLTKEQEGLLNEIKGTAERTAKEKIDQLSEANNKIKQRKASPLVRQLRKLSKAGLEEQININAKKNKMKFSEKMFANKSDAKETRSRLDVK